MTRPTPPAAWDRHALEVARGIAQIDRSKLPGLTTQYVAILQSAIVDAMVMASGGPSITVKPAMLTLNAPGVCLTDEECAVLRGIAERMRRCEEAKEVAA